MTEENKTDKPKLKLKNPSLSVSKPGEKVRLLAPKKPGLLGGAGESKLLRPKSNTSESNDKELNNRIHLLKKAAEDSKEKEIENERISKAKQEIVANVKNAAETTKENKTKSVETPVEKTNTKHNKDSFKPAKTSTTTEETTVKEKVPTKIKKEEPRKLQKAQIFGILNEEESGSVKTRSLASIKRAREKEKRKLESVKQEKIYREVIIPEIISVGDLASRMSERVADVIKELMKLGMIANANQNIDADTAELIVTTMGHTFKRVQESDIENILTVEPDEEKDLKPRAPVVTVMGHVDHGKTSLLDALKSTDIAAGEAGGITQHIGAYRVNLASGNSISFIDTPGHEAFTEMRSRGAKITDIVVLVVAADDGIMAQTVEAINHAKAAEVPIIVAVNKIDKPDANIEKVKNELLSHELIPEDLGGDIVVVPVSAKTRQNIDKLEEAILLIAEMAELKSNPVAPASGAVIESEIDKGKGVIATLLVQRGTLKVGDIIVAGSCYGKVKKLIDDKGKVIKECLPSMPAEVWGLNSAPLAGEEFSVVETEKQARDIADYRQRKANDSKHLQAQKSSLEELFSKATGSNAIKELPVIIKGDVQGSIEAISHSLQKIKHDEVKIKILHTAVGGITESDITLASASNAIVVGFNVRGSNSVALSAEKLGIDVRYYSVIYNLIDDIKAILGGMLTPIIREEYIGSVEIRKVYNITKVGKVAGSYVTKGIIKRGAGVRLLRDNIVIHEGKLKTLKRFKDDVKEVRENFECGIAFENYDDIKDGDTVEVYEIVEEKKTL